MFVSPGDLEKYAFCPLSWWLSKEYKVVYKEGVKHHKKIGDELKEIKEKEKKVKFYEKYILFFSVAATLVAISGIAFLYEEIQTFWRYFFVVLALMWLLISVFFLYRATKVVSILKPKYERLLLLSSMGAILIAFFSFLFSSPANRGMSLFAEILAIIWIVVANLLFYRGMYLGDKVVEKKIRYIPIKGEIEYIGEDREKEIVSEKYGIRGKPDYILKIDDEYIPVEEKTSDLQSPIFPHVIQITAYCMLIEDKYGVPPPYGILKYKNAEFKIPYEKRWKEVVMQLRENMIKDMEKGVAHRNHNNPKKCARCIRREYCPERLS